MVLLLRYFTVFRILRDLCDFHIYFMMISRPSRLQSSVRYRHMFFSRCCTLTNIVASSRSTCDVHIYFIMISRPSWPQSSVRYHHMLFSRCYTLTSPVASSRNNELSGTMLCRFYRTQREGSLRDKLSARWASA